MAKAPKTPRKKPGPKPKTKGPAFDVAAIAPVVAPAPAPKAAPAPVPDEPKPLNAPMAKQGVPAEVVAVRVHPYLAQIISKAAEKRGLTLAEVCEAAVASFCGAQLRMGGTYIGHAVGNVNREEAKWVVGKP